MRAACFLGVWLLLIVCAQATAQSGPFTITGTVRDQSGANVPNAVVTLARGRETSATRTGTNGAFSFDKVLAGTYDIRVEQEGYKIATSRVTVTNRAPRPIDLKLEIATLQQGITVFTDVNQFTTQTDDNRDVASLDHNALDNVPIFDQNHIATISRFLDTSAIQEVKINQNPYSPEFFAPAAGASESLPRLVRLFIMGLSTLFFRDNRVNAREPFASTRPQEQRRIRKPT